MHADILRYLRCPVCSGSLRLAGAALRCDSGHSFDLARQGYVDLSAGRLTHAGDTAEMIAARQDLLAEGHFRVLTEALVVAVGDRRPGFVVDVGAGTGQHLAGVLDARPDDLGLAVDVSKPALRRAARAHPRLAAVRADAWRGLPVADGAADVVLDVFAPRSGPEFHRILRADGVLVVVTPAVSHLRELVEALDLVRVDPAKSERLSATLGPQFVKEDERRHEWPLRLSAARARTAVAMGPSAWHTDPARLDSLPESLTVTAAVDVTRWRPRR
ncbi:putative RNA methyltransferase [Planosporangium mesophilum]|uniref:Ubiquinone biosynthesis protein n=1 Tax=Planosporangium mesophilum TaxID=689768 RepID=A0A8J3WYH7_9ACTN|nr:methyltransferase domain-containing protein [Planosporangium mesophilum]NJC81162.1 methyltransferase domain-containing protein [Planosporangium mesophilum]GII21187.1 ubiquinone biosynthesis protein [Planosporangium mesophilum]